MVLWTRILKYQRRWQRAGMGLAVVNGIVENHEGAILVESEPEKGTMVAVYFPSVDEDTIHEAAF